MLLGRTAKDLPTIRKIDEAPPRISIIDVISAITSKTSPIVLGFRYGESSLDTMGLTQFALTSKPPSPRQRDTAITNAKGIIEVIVLMRGAPSRANTPRTLAP